MARVSPVIEEGLVRGSIAMARMRPWPASLAFGERLGDLARMLALRRRVAESQIALTFPERSAAERTRILIEHYREVGRVWVDYAHMPELVRAPIEHVAPRVRGLEHRDAAEAMGRGVILVTGHYSSFELFAALIARERPVDVVVKPLSNPRVDRLLAERRRACGLGTIPLSASVRGLLTALRAGRWLAMAADQDARQQGVFVPFLGRPASTHPGPARLSILTGAPILMGFATRFEDGRLDLTYEPPILSEDPRAPDAVRTLTARHAAVLERWVRAHPELWFWLHRRWKTQPAVNEGALDVSAPTRR
jgi:KDO2-lipid IV(A) lauroyltransferase